MSNKPSALSRSSCSFPSRPSPTSLPSFGLSLIDQCLFHVVMPKTAHRTQCRADCRVFLRLILVLFLPMSLHVNGEVNRDFQPLSVTKQSTDYREMSLSLWKLISLRKISWASLPVSSFSGDEGLEDLRRPERRTSPAKSLGEI